MLSSKPAQDDSTRSLRHHFVGRSPGFAKQARPGVKPYFETVLWPDLLPREQEFWVLVSESG
jgi:hypothetical protein